MTSSLFSGESILVCSITCCSISDWLCSRWSTGITFPSCTWSKNSCSSRWWSASVSLKTIALARDQHTSAKYPNSWANSISLPLGLTKSTLFSTIAKGTYNSNVQSVCSGFSFNLSLCSSEWRFGWCCEKNKKNLMYKWKSLVVIELKACEWDGNDRSVRLFTMVSTYGACEGQSSRCYCSCSNHSHQIVCTKSSTGITHDRTLEIHKD